MSRGSLAVDFPQRTASLPPPESEEPVSDAQTEEAAAADGAGANEGDAAAADEAAANDGANAEPAPGPSDEEVIQTSQDAFTQFNWENQINLRIANLDAELDGSPVEPFAVDPVSEDGWSYPDVFNGIGDDRGTGGPAAGPPPPDPIVENYEEIYADAEAALAEVPSDLRTLTFEVEKEDGGAEYLVNTWENALHGALGPGDPGALDDALERNEHQLEVLSNLAFDDARPMGAGEAIEDFAAEHLYEPVITTLAAENEGATFELVAADRSDRGAASYNELPMVAMTTADGETQFFEINPDAVYGLGRAQFLEEAAYESGTSDAFYEAFQNRPEFAALDEGTASDTLYQVSLQHPEVAFDVIGDLDPDHQVDLMQAYAQRAGADTVGGIARPINPPDAVLVAVNANHLATGGGAPDMIRSTVDINGVPNNGKAEAVLEEHRDALYAPIFAEYAARGERPPMEGTDLVNEIGAALGIPPNVDIGEHSADFEAGNLAFFEGDSLDRIQPIVDQIEANSDGPVSIQTIPVMLESDVTGRPPAAPIPVFRVETEDGSVFFVDDVGQRFDSVGDWREHNALPHGTLTYPEGLDLSPADPDRPLDVETITESSRTTREAVLEWGDRFAFAAGVGLGGLAIFASGGTATPAVAATLTWGGATLGAYEVGRGLYELDNIRDHGGSINPLESGEARSLWLQTAAGGFSFAALGTPAFGRVVGNGSRLGTAAHLAPSAVDLAAAGDAAYQAVTHWDELDDGQKAQAVLQIGFWGSMAGVTAGSPYGGRSVRRQIDNATESLDAAAADAFATVYPGGDRTAINRYLDDLRGDQLAASRRGIDLSEVNAPGIVERLSSDPRVIGMDDWVAAHRGEWQGADGAQHRLDYVNELREFERRLDALRPGETLDINETAIPGAGTNSTVDGYIAANDTYVEIKTVRDPIVSSPALNGQILEAARKFDGAGPGINGEIVVYASVSPDLLAGNHFTASGRQQGYEDGMLHTYRPDTGERVRSVDFFADLERDLNAQMRRSPPDNPGLFQTERIVVRLDSGEDAVFERNGTRWVRQ